MYLKNEENLNLEIRGGRFSSYFQKQSQNVWGSTGSLWLGKKKKKKKWEKLCGAVDTLEVRDVLHRDFATLERGNSANLMRFNKAKCKVLHLGRDSPETPTGWVESGWEQPSRERLGCDEKLNMSQLTAQKANELHQQECGQVSGSNAAPQLCSCETQPGFLHPALGPPT